MWDFFFSFPVFSVYFLFRSRAAIANRHRWKVPCWRGRSMFPPCHSSLAANDWLGFAMEETTSKYLPLQISHTRRVNANGNSIALVWEKPRIWRMTKPNTDIFQAQFSCLSKTKCNNYTNNTLFLQGIQWKLLLHQNKQDKTLIVEASNIITIFCWSKQFVMMYAVSII